MSVYSYHALLGNYPVLSEILVDIDTLDIFVCNSAHRFTFPCKMLILIYIVYFFYIYIIFYLKE